MGFGTRTPTSNEQSIKFWPYGPQEPHDDTSILLNDLGKRCTKCKRVTINKYIKNGQCPDCVSKNE